MAVPLSLFALSFATSVCEARRSCHGRDSSQLDLEGLSTASFAIDDASSQKRQLPIVAIAVASSVGFLCLLLMGILCLRARCFRRPKVIHNQGALSREESFYSKPPPATPVPVFPQYHLPRPYFPAAYLKPLDQSRAVSRASTIDLIECYMAPRDPTPPLKHVDALRYSRHMVPSIPYAPGMNYSRPSSFYASSETLSGSFDDKAIMPPSPLHSTFAPVYELRDPGIGQ
ncbi:hypothetical protein C8J56DRAFT_167498 [Mycena floridula]|nr:hypothetical protein C8J56DRAFT_167498 [Mycena floridula]